MTLISHAFKSARFLELHVPAIRWPGGRFTFVGIDPPESVTPKAELCRGEEERGFGVWMGDLYGVGDVLARKRRERGWVEEKVEEVLRGLEGGEREMVRGLVEWKGGKDGREVFWRVLPWDERGGFE